MAVAIDDRPANFAGSLHYGVIQSEIGSLFAAERDDALCHLGLLGVMTQADALADLQRTYPQAAIKPGGVMSLADGVSLPQLCNFRGKVLISGTPFQLAVWRALLKLPTGQTTSYGRLAREIGKPRAARAVGQAVGANSLAVIIPCHRVLPADGTLGSYRWGVAMKQRVLELEKNCGD